MQYSRQELVAVIDQYNIYHAWIFNKDGELLCEAKDMRQFGKMSKDRANEIGKLNRQITKLNKQKIKSIQQLEKIKNIKTFQYEQTLPDPVKEQSDFQDSDFETVIEFNSETDNTKFDDDIFNTDIIEFNN